MRIHSYCRRAEPLLWAMLLVWLFAAGARGDTTAVAARYKSAAQRLEEFIRSEVSAKGLPAVSITVVDDRAVLWTQGFGHQRPKEKIPATGDTVYRVGSVSKLFTDIGIMQLVEEGKLDLDAPVSQYLPDFQPKNSTAKAITLRQLMAHRSGLVREPPVGHYFDPDGPTLAATVASLNSTELVYPPMEKLKYSNAAIAVVGYVLEKARNKPFEDCLEERVLAPLGMKNSGFRSTPALQGQLARALMWTYHGRTFDAPDFPLGMAPAGSMYSTVNDLGKFLQVLLRGGELPEGRLLKRESIEAMWKPQFAPPDAKSGFGIGFMLADYKGQLRVGHGGAIYGFATELVAVPQEKLGVVVVASKDCANAVTKRIADTALDMFLAAKNDKPLPEVGRTEAIPLEECQSLAGRYESKERGLELLERGGKLFLLRDEGGFLAEVRKRGSDLIVDDTLQFGPTIVRRDGALVIGKEQFQPVVTKKPEPLPEKWRGLIGEYGWDHNVLFILEKQGKLHALIEWFFLYPLEQLEENVFRFPGFGLYHDEKLIFKRDANGRAMEVVAASVPFRRRNLDGENGETFRIRPIRAIEEIRKEALAAKPPREELNFLRTDLVELIKLHPTIKLDVRYASTNNFLSTPFYTSERAFLQRPAAEALVRAHRRLAVDGYGLLIHDGYRPWHVTKMFWEATPERQHMFVADPSQGSRHNRGCAVDLTLYELATGKPVAMVGGYDEMSDRSYPRYLGGASLQRWHQELLRRAMELEGFKVIDEEWWHFDYKDWKKYPILNVTFEKLSKGGEGKR